MNVIKNYYQIKMLTADKYFAEAERLRNMMKDIENKYIPINETHESISYKAKLTVSSTHAKYVNWLKDAYQEIVALGATYNLNDQNDVINIMQNPEEFNSNLLELVRSNLILRSIIDESILRVEEEILTQNQDFTNDFVTDTANIEYLFNNGLISKDSKDTFTLKYTLHKYL